MAIEAARDAEARARSEALRWKSWKPDTPLTHAVAVSRSLEPFVISIFMPIDTQRAEDLVLPLTIARERIKDKRTHAEPAKQGGSMTWPSPRSTE